MSQSESGNTTSSSLKWWQLSLVGIGCTIGIGYFLGSAIGIKLTGPSIIFSFILAAIGTYFVYNVLAKMTVEDPQEGSFCYYAYKAFGRWARFGCGWNFWFSNILIMGSQLIGLALLTQLWFPTIPLWVFSAIYAVLSIVVVLLGTDGFDKVEDILAVIKTAAIFMFILIGGLVVFGVIAEDPVTVNDLPLSSGELFIDGFTGFWASLIYAFYAFSGIEVIGIMAIRLKKKEDAPKAGKIMLGLLTVIYVVSLMIAVLLVPIESFSQDESPFVTALQDYTFSIFPVLFNGAIIIAGFSTLTAALFGVTTLLVTLAKDKDAPSLFAKKLKRYKDLPIYSIGLGAAGLFLSVITALLLPNKIYEYITTAAGILILYNWFFIIISAWKILKMTMFMKVCSSVGILLILLAVSGTVMDGTVRPGLYISFLLTGIICVITFVMNRKWKH